MTNPLTAVVSRRTWLATLHVILDLYVSAVTFTVVVTLLSLGLGLAITVVLAVPIVWLLFAASAWLGRVERTRAAALLGLVVADPHPSVTGSFLGRLRARATSGATWREIGYHLLLLPAGSVGASLVIAAWSGAVVLLALPLVVQATHDHVANFGLFTLSGGSLWLGSLAGLGALLVAPWVARGWARLDEALVLGLLGPSRHEALLARVDDLTSTRALAVDAAEEERRRIERDLHDGAQQRLVALAMDLGRAQAKFDDDPDAARELLGHAHQEAKRSIAELRDLARGIHPVALTERGIAGAVPGLVARSPIPVEVSIEVPDRPSPAIEGIAYFVVSEALTNTVKYSGASAAAVRIETSGGRLRVAVSDNGHGGASLVAGGGLRGLQDRVASVDGTLELISPEGGPTHVVADLPATTEVPR